jgi:histidinol dehydrogenase
MTGLFRVYGSVAALPDSVWDVLLNRGAALHAELRQRTAELVEDVRRHGDAALRRQALELDGVSCAALEVPAQELERALAGLDPSLRAALARAAANIRAVHYAFRPVPMRARSPDGAVLLRRPDPLECAGVYAPGGRAAYPSSLLMGAVPARVAGVREVIVCSPALEGGFPDPLVLAAAAIAKADRVFAAGGAGAIAAMAFGTESIPRVQCIVGPGNAWVDEAKRQLAGTVRIDAPAGPSELLILADDSASPDRLAHELTAQAEHDPDAAVVLVTTEPGLIRQVETALQTMIASAPRAEIIREALARRGGALVAHSLDEALEFAARYAAEHVLLACRGALAAAGRVRNAGSIFVGESSSVVFGDYLTGSNHVLPTGGAARTWSGLSTDTFVRWTTVQETPAGVAAILASDSARLARAEGLDAHARAARMAELVP